MSVELNGSEWKQTDRKLPDERELVTIRLPGSTRAHYYRIDGRWYDLADLEQWRMNRSPHWNSDRSWYLKTDQVEAWKYESAHEG